MKFMIAAIALLTAATPTIAADHPCADDARKRGEILLRLHFTMDAGDPLTNFAAEPVHNFGVDTEVKVLPPIEALSGKGKFDVLEVFGSIYKAEYRMRFIYAQIKDTCALMGQEILEASDPY